jgi:hypothetical protein
MQPMQSKRPTQQNPKEIRASKHLENIDRLLRAAFDLMKQTPALDQTAFEQLRQLRVRIRYALSTAPTETSDAPKTAPELFRDRQDKDEDPLAFTKRVYTRWLGKNLHRSDIKKLDAQLYNALYNLDNPSEKLTSIGLLTKKQLNDVKLQSLTEMERPSMALRIGELPPDQQERARLFNLARTRKHRAKS